MNALDKARAEREAREAAAAQKDLEALAAFKDDFESLLDKFAPVSARMRSQKGKMHADRITAALRTGFDQLEQAGSASE